MTKYLSISLGVITILLFIYCLLLRTKNNNALDKIDNLTSQLETVVKANQDLNASVELLEKQSKEEREYINDLEIKRRDSEKRADDAEKRFKQVKSSNKAVNTWASGILPSGLY